VIVRETRRLSATVTELLSLAEAGSQALRAAPVRLDAIAAEACDEMRALAPDRSIEAELEPTAIAGDAGRLGELVRVLVDNALKYSPPGEPVTVTVSEVAGPTLAVRDRGRGLSAEDRERAFDRFYRGSAAGQVAGSGLGLAIAQSICERHRAVLTLEPAMGGGTVATARFPPPHAPVAPQMLDESGTRDSVAGGALLFDYPKAHQPAVLIRVDADRFVAYGQKCTHLSCPVIPRVDEGRLHCPCHEGSFDLATGRPLAGPPRRPLARVTLQVRQGRIYATAVEERTT